MKSRIRRGEILKWDLTHHLAPMPQRLAVALDNLMGDENRKHEAELTKLVAKACADMLVRSRRLKSEHVTMVVACLVDQLITAPAVIERYRRDFRPHD